MLRSIELKEPGTLDSGTPLLAVILGEQPVLSEGLAAKDAESGGSIQRALDARDFRGSKDETLHVTPSGGEGPRRILLVGTGPVTDRPGSLRRASAIAAREANRLGVSSLAVLAPEPGERDVEAIAAGIYAGAWEYADLKATPPEKDRRDRVESGFIMAPDSGEARRGLAGGIAIGEGHSLARRLAMMPGNLATPDHLADTAREIGERHGMHVTVLGRTDLEREGMGAFLAVAQGTPQDPKLICLEYRAGADAAPLVLVGKGLCFDTGGISIKPAQAMELMKFDMSGAAAVLGAMDSIGRLRLPLNVVALIGATTNMPSGTAYKPGDVVRAHNGKFIEVINTDAEGRMVLADLLSYARRYNPAVVVDAATLTGAVVIALGHTAMAIFSPDDGLAAEIVAAGKRAGEPAWVMPLWDEYREIIKSDIADMKNAGGRAAGAISAAKFLQEFAEGYPWVHLDVAGTAYSEVDLVALPRGPTGVPVGTFVEFARGRLS